MVSQQILLEGLELLSPRIFSDERGFFLESYHQERLAYLGSFVQDNLVYSKRGVIRGLHYQEGEGQSKLVTCLMGKIWDVAVDLRTGSPTFGQWNGVFLDARSSQQFFIPRGFAHGYCVLSEEALVLYKVGSFYDPLLERSIRWNDPDLAVAWPEEAPILSERDQKSPLFKELFS